MPETTRRWPTGAQMAAKVMTRVSNENPGIANNPVLEAAVTASIEAWFAGGGHDIERKISRLTEQLKNSLERGDFTTVAPVLVAFREIYDTDFLAQFDEEGIPLL